MFDLLADRLQKAFNKLKNKGKITNDDLDSALRDVRLSLLESDVNFKVVKDFINSVREKAIGIQILNSLTPAQQIIKIVNEELTEILGKTGVKPSYAPKPPTIFMLVGLQGSGKTTSCVKLCKWLQKDNKKPFVIAADTQRPAAIDQLIQLCTENSVDSYFSKDTKNPVEIVKNGLSKAKNDGYQAIIIDTAGRLHIDDILMDELVNIKKIVIPHYILLVVDAMTGQDAVNLATSFNEKVGIDGTIITKLDGDARGGAALSIKSVVGKPIMFASFGEKMDSFDTFHPDRIASRILGMGDVLTLIEKAEEVAGRDEAEKLQKKMIEGKYDLEDFLSQMKGIKKMGPISQILKLMPNMPGLKDMSMLNIDDKQVSRMEAIILSMTKEERFKPEILNSSRRQRIAKGSGSSIYEVNNLIKSFMQSKKMLKKLKDLPFGKMKNLPFLK